MTGGVASVTGAWARPRPAGTFRVEAGAPKTRTRVSLCLTLTLPSFATGRVARSARLRSLARRALRGALATALVLLVVAAEATAMWLFLGR